MTIKIKTISLLIGLFQLINCQEKKTLMPIYNVEISHPENRYLIEPVLDKIITLEGKDAHLPYGSSSGNWGDSGKMFTKQSGTPIGVDIVYYSGYEDTFYNLKIDFPKDQMKEMVRRAYLNDENDDCEDLQEFVYTDQEYCDGYNDLGDLVFGFAPKGMVVVWLRFGYIQKEIGRFQAEVIKDDKKYEEKLFASWSMNRQEVKARDFDPDASPQLWDNYRKRYSWAPFIHSENKGFRLFNIQTEYYNGERNILLRPRVQNPKFEELAIPKMIQFLWETGKGESFEGRAFFNWEKTNEAFTKAGKDFKLEFKIAPDNDSFEIVLNGQKFKADSLRLYKSERKFKESYK